MNSISEIEEKIDEIFCIRNLNDQIEHYGLIRLTEMALKLVDDLEKQTQTKEINLCKKIIEFLISLVLNCTSSASSTNSKILQNQQQSDLKSTNEDKDANGSKKKRPPTPPKKPKINRNFHSFQFNAPTGKDQNELGASNTSLSTTISNSSLSTNQQHKKSPAQQSITGTRTSSTFASISKNGQAKHQSINNQFLNQHQKLNPSYTETCLDKDTNQTHLDENAYEIKDLGFGSKPQKLNLNSFGVNSKLLNKQQQQSNQSSHNSYPRQLHNTTTNNSYQNDQLRSKLSSFQFNQHQQNQQTNSLKESSLNFGSTDALNKNSSLKNRFFSRKGSLDKHTSNQTHHAYLPDFGRRNLRLSDDFEQRQKPSDDKATNAAINDQTDEEELSILQKSLDDNNGELNFESYETEEELDKKDGETEEDDEAIYDTVAPDEVNVGNANNQVVKNKTQSASNLKASLVKSIKNSFENNRFINQSLENLDVNNDGDKGTYSNYVNIDYFLRSKNDSDDCDTQMSQSLSSDHDIDESIVPVVNKLNLANGTLPISDATYDEVFECKKELKNSKSSVLSAQCSIESNGELDEEEDIIRTEADLLSMYRSIIKNIIESEKVYLDCLDTLIQYKKALKSSTESTKPLLKPEQLECIFFQIPELFEMHKLFIVGVQELSHSSGDNNSTAIKIKTNTPTLGDLFKNLASQLDVYSKYLRNYSNALDTLSVCCQNNEQFNDIAMSVKLKSQKITTTLQELLHKPVARVQKNALVLHDLLKYTAQHSEEYKSLQTALQMTQCFLNDLNIAATEQLFPVIFLNMLKLFLSLNYFFFFVALIKVQDKAQRRLVKESFIIEFCDGKRKLRHLILFNDILVCAKYKPSSRQKFTFDLKWYASLADITLPDGKLFFYETIIIMNCILYN